MFFLILFTFFFVFDVVWAVWADLRLRRMPRARVWRAISAGAMVVFVGTLLWWMAVRRLDLPPPPSILLSLAYVWHMLVLPLAVAGLMVWGIFKGMRWGWRWVLSFRAAAAPLENQPEPQAVADSMPTGGARALQPGYDSPGAIADLALSRRQFLGTTAAVAPLVFAFGATGIGSYQLTGFRVRRLIVPIPTLPAELDGMTIAHVTDSHVGRFTRGRVLDAIVDTTATLDDGKPCDLVLFTGDLINDATSDLDMAVDMARRLVGRSGSYFVEGNHDLFGGIDLFDNALRQAGLNLLTNQSAFTEVRGHPVQILGLQWGPAVRHPRQRYRGDDPAIRDSMKVLGPQVDPGAFPILLAHHPHALDYAGEYGIPLTLAGHTHGGQLMLSESIGPGPLMYRYWSGLYRTPDGTAGVISNGVGNWFPLRINAPAEIIHLTLTRSSAGIQPPA